MLWRRGSRGASSGKLSAAFQALIELKHRSCSRLSYADAQSVIDGKTLDEAKVNEHSNQDVAKDIVGLHVSIEASCLRV